MKQNNNQINTLFIHFLPRQPTNNNQNKQHRNPQNQVRPQFRPALRRPSVIGSATATTPATTTSARDKSTRRSESGESATTDSSLVATPTTTPASPLSRRRRPPATYLSKLNGAAGTAAANRPQRPAADEATPGPPPSDNGQPPKSRPKVGVRRKFGASTARTGSPEEERSATTTSAKSPDLETTTRVNSLFKRRPSLPSPNRISTPVTPNAGASKLFNKNRIRSSTEHPEQQGPPSPVLNDGDQEIEPSIRQNSKLANSKNRYNQIGETSLEDDVLDAITTISRAPLPISSTTSRNFLFPNETPEELEQHMQKMKVLNIGELPTHHNQRATTHKYNITHEYTLHSFSEPYSTTRRSQKLIQQRPRISTQSQFYYQQTTPSQYYSSTQGVTLNPRKDSVQRKRKPSSYEKSSYASNHRKQKDDFVGRTYRPVTDYDYYDDGEQRIIGKTSSQVKVIMHGPGIIECLDQGNFPHPLSCKKFISCAKMEIGGVVGWEYTCPKGLSYDPVGGICNWSAGLGCKD